MLVERAKLPAIRPDTRRSACGAARVHRTRRTARRREKSTGRLNLMGSSALSGFRMQRHLGEPVHLVTSGLDSAAVVGPLSLLVVEPAIDELLAVVTTLSEAGFNVTAAQTFEEARPFLAARPPWVL